MNENKITNNFKFINNLPLNESKKTLGVVELMNKTVNDLKYIINIMYIRRGLKPPYKNI